MDDDAMMPNDDPAVRAFRAMNSEADARHAAVMARLAEAPDYAPSFALTNKKLDWLVKACTNGRTVDDLLAQVEDATTLSIWPSGWTPTLRIRAFHSCPF